MTLNDSQQRIADTLEGMIVVDAGPGTGKTHTVVTRCINIIRKRDFNPKDLVMLTFTKNAASEMKERVQGTLAGMLESGDIDRREFERLSGIAKQVNIGTFDSFCLSIVKQAPAYISRFFGLEEGLTRGADIVENESINRIYFERFMDRFLAERGAEFGDVAAIAAEAPSEVYNLLNRLMARGILPLRQTPEGRRPWFGGNDGRDLVGDIPALRELMEGFEGLGKDALKKYRDIPSAEGFDLNCKNPVPLMLDRAANDDRTVLLDLIHDIYYEFIRSSVADDHLTFGLVASFAFIILYSDDSARERAATRYLIVDEFQDTNSNQLMISLMVLKEPNLCVVGDWKQGIYGFRFVSIENITRFEARVVELRRFLNDDKVRVGFSIPETVKLPLDENYRSSQLIIDRAYESLKIPGTQKEVIDTAELEKQITYIRSKRTEIGKDTAFECVKCETKEGEIEEVLRRIDSYRLSGKYRVWDKGAEAPRAPEYRDIAVLCRTTEACRTVYDACRERGIPAFLQGEIDIMSTREGKLLLAWLRYLSNDKDMWGLVPILADLKYPYDEIRWMIEYDRAEGRDHVPEWIKNVRNRLRSKKRRITQLISDIFAEYGLDNDITQAIIHVLSSTHRTSLLTISDLIGIIENDIAKDTKYDVDGLPECNAVTIQTLHKSKGLEYPIVIIPRVDQRNLPLPPSSKELFTFSDLTGIRCRKEIVEFGGEKKIAESWKSAVVRKSLKPDYSEERRLLFVGISRAQQYVTLIAGKSPTQFFTHYTERGMQVEGDVPAPFRSTVETQLVERPVIAPFRERRKNLAVHDLLHFDMRGHRPEGDADEFSGRGMQYGTEVHRYAELLVKGISVPAETFETYPQLQNVVKVLEGLKGMTLHAERHCSLPLEGTKITLSGTIDMMAESEDRIEVHDWKTDVESIYGNEYRIQLTAYALVLRELYPGKEVVCVIDWVSQGRSERFDPLDVSVLRERAEEFLSVPRKG
ncbi:MAG: UvrD-helicase domain-containing protein [archaeon]|nr:UvrD-helicase domain-containing protein [archaeon]